MYGATALVNDGSGVFSGPDVFAYFKTIDSEFAEFVSMEIGEINNNGYIDLCVRAMDRLLLFHNDGVHPIEQADAEISPEYADETPWGENIGTYYVLYATSLAAEDQWDGGSRWRRTK